MTNFSIESILRPEEDERWEPNPKKVKIEYLDLKDNLYQELVGLKKNEDLERNTMDREIQEVLDKQKLKRKEFVCNQNLRLETFKANQKTERDGKERSFEEEQESKIRPRREKLESSQKRRERIEANLRDIYEKEIFENDIPLLRCICVIHCCKSEKFIK